MASQTRVIRQVAYSGKTKSGLVTDELGIG